MAFEPCDLRLATNRKINRLACSPWRGRLLRHDQHGYRAFEIARKRILHGGCSQRMAGVPINSNGRFRLSPESAHRPSILSPGSTVNPTAWLGKPLKIDRPGYSCERTQWVLVTGAEPLNCLTPPNLHESLTHNVRLRLPQGQILPEIRQAGSAEAFVGCLPLAGNNVIFSAAPASVKPPGFHHSTFNLQPS